MSNYPHYQQGPAAYPRDNANNLAIASFVVGIASFILFPFIGGIAAIIMGHMALGKVGRQRKEGRGFALAGTILGYVNAIGVSLLIIAASVLLPLIVDQVRTSTDRSVESDVRDTVASITEAQKSGLDNFIPVISDEDTELVFVYDKAISTTYGGKQYASSFVTPAPGFSYVVCAFNKGGKEYEEEGFSFSSTTGTYGTASDCSELYRSHSTLQ